MNQQLIPIIAAYWGAETSHLNGWANPEQIWETLNENNFHHISRPSFKLHLRPLWSITEEELGELGNAVLYNSFEIEANNEEKSVIRYNAGITIYNLGHHVSFDFWGGGDRCGDWNIKIINHLRAKGFCVDQELVESNLVEWKEVGNGSN